MARPAPNSLACRAESLRRAGEVPQAPRPFAVVTVVRTQPSTSPPTGNPVIVFPEGSMEGVVGGGGIHPPARSGNPVCVFPDGSREGWSGGGCRQPTARREGLAAPEDGEPRPARISPDTAASQHNVRMARMTCASERTADLYVEPFLPRPTLVAAGDSPLIATLAAIAPPLGFRFVQIETGAELNRELVPPPPDTWLVVATL